MIVQNAQKSIKKRKRRPKSSLKATFSGWDKMSDVDNSKRQITIPVSHTLSNPTPSLNPLVVQICNQTVYNVPIWGL